MSSLTQARALIEAELRHPDDLRREIAAMRPIEQARLRAAAWHLWMMVPEPKNPLHGLEFKAAPKAGVLASLYDGERAA